MYYNYFILWYKDTEMLVLLPVLIYCNNIVTGKETSNKKRMRYIYFWMYISYICWSHIINTECAFQQILQQRNLYTILYALIAVWWIYLKYIFKIPNVYTF